MVENDGLGMLLGMCVGWPGGDTVATGNDSCRRDNDVVGRADW